MRKTKVKNYGECWVRCYCCNELIDVTAAVNVWMAARAGKAGSREAKQRAAIERWSLNRKERKQAES